MEHTAIGKSKSHPVRSELNPTDQPTDRFPAGHLGDSENPRLVSVDAQKFGSFPAIRPTDRMKPGSGEVIQVNALGFVQSRCPGDRQGHGRSGWGSRGCVDVGPRGCRGDTPGFGSHLLGIPQDSQTFLRSFAVFQVPLGEITAVFGDLHLAPTVPSRSHGPLDRVFQTFVRIQMVVFGPETETVPDADVGSLDHGKADLFVAHLGMNECAVLVELPEGSITAQVVQIDLLLGCRAAVDFESVDAGVAHSSKSGDQPSGWMMGLQTGLDSIGAQERGRILPYFDCYFEGSENSFDVFLQFLNALCSPLRGGSDGKAKGREETGHDTLHGCFGIEKLLIDDVVFGDGSRKKPIAKPFVLPASRSDLDAQ